MTYRFGSTRQPGSYTFGVGGLGVRGADLPQTGTHGPGINALDPVLPAEADDEFMYRVTTVPPLLTLFRYFDDGSVEAEGPVGSHTGVAERKKNGVVYGSAPFYVQIGGSGSLTGGVVADDAVAGGSLAPAPPGTLTGGITAEDATASGQIDGNPAPAPFQPRHNVTLLYAAANPLLTPDLTVKDPLADRTLEADFSPFTAITDPVWTVARIGGDDGTPPLVKEGSATVSGGKSYQRVSGGSSGSTYDVRCDAKGPGGIDLVAAGRLPVRTLATPPTP